MTLIFSRVFLVFAFGMGIVSIAYIIFAIRCLLELRPKSDLPARAWTPAVTVLKPLCGLDSGLIDNIRSFCQQDYPTYQIVFGVRYPDDPAVAVVRRVMAEYPERDISLVVDEGIIGTNLKVSNLANMYRTAKHEILVISDSDMRVTPDYLSTVAASFEDPKVGAVTCLYRGHTVSGVASRLGSMFINEWFVPSVLVALSFRKLSFCFGATMGVRRDVLQAIGGFEVLASHLADDHMLGKMINGLGYRIALSPYIVQNMVSEPSFRDLFQHELRWARTIRTVEPLGHAFSFVTYIIPMAMLAGIADEVSVDTEIFELGFGAFAIGLRIVLHYVAHAALRVSERPTPWLVPIRDILGFMVWAAGFFSRRVQWKSNVFQVRTDGHMVIKGRENS